MNRPQMASKRAVLLIHPPVAKPCEPPAGIASLAGALGAAGVDYRVWDANLDGMLFLLENPPEARDTWSRRALRHLPEHLDALRTNPLYGSLSRYKRAVMDVNRMLHLHGRRSGVNLSLANYTVPELSPVRSDDLLKAAEQFEDNPFYPLFRRRLDAFFGDRAPDIVGISLNFMSQALCASAIAGWIRNRCPRHRIVMGGGLVTSWMHIPGFSNPFKGLIDDLVCGPGEESLVSMAGGPADRSRSGGSADFSDLPMNDYLAPVRVLPYAASRGCYWERCSFCPEKAEKSGYHPVPPAQAACDIGHLTSAVRPRLIHFLDNALSPRMMQYLIDHPPGVPWYGFVRITRHLADADFVRGLKASGCVMLKLGVESGDQAVLDALGKGVELETVTRALGTLKAASIATYVYLLFGTPTETIESARKTLAFTLDNADTIDFLNLAVFNLPAYGEEAGRLATDDFYQGDLSLYRNFSHPRGWHRERVRRFLSREFTSPGPIRSILAADPPFFTSNHAPFLVMNKSTQKGAVGK